MGAANINSRWRRSWGGCTKRELRRSAQRMEFSLWLLALANATFQNPPLLFLFCNSVLWRELNSILTTVGFYPPTPTAWYKSLILHLWNASSTNCSPKPTYSTLATPRSTYLCVSKEKLIFSSTLVLPNAPRFTINQILIAGLVAVVHQTRIRIRILRCVN